MLNVPLAPTIRPELAADGDFPKVKQTEHSLSTVGAESRNYLALVVSATLTLCACIVGLLLSRSESEAMMLCAASLSLFVLLIPVFLETRLNLLHPLALFGLSVFMGTTLRAYFLVLSNGEAKHKLLLNQPPETVLPGALIILIGTTAISAGFGLTAWMASTRDDTVQHPGLWNLRRIDVIAILCSLISAVACWDILRVSGVDFQSMGVEDLSQKRRVAIEGSSEFGGHFAAMGYHTWAASVICYPYYMYLVHAFSAPRLTWPNIIRCGLAGLAAMIPQFLLSSRMGLIEILLTTLAIIGFHVVIQLRYILTIASFIVAIWLVMGTLREGDRIWRTGNILTDAVDQFNGTHNYVDLTKHSQLYEALPNRLSYLYGTSYFTWIFAPIPRVVWPDKPVLTNEVEVTAALYGGRIHKTGIASGGATPLGVIGEAMRNFGLAGVPVISGLYGIALGYFYRNLKRASSGSNKDKLVYGALLFCVTFFASDIEFSRVIIKATQVVVICYLFVWLVQIPKSASGRMPPIRIA